MKTCYKCKIKKTLDEFYNLSSSKDGKQYNCKECRKKEYKKNKKKINKEYQKEYSKQWRIKNKEKIKQKKKIYYKNNKEKITEDIKTRRKKDSLFRMRGNLGSRTRIAFKRSKWRKNSSNIEMLGCTYEEAFKHIENQFTEGMTWANHSYYGWHIDHIIPLASAKTEEELKSLCHYTNLQPLWAEDNLSKGAKITD